MNPGIDSFGYRISKTTPSENDPHRVVGWCFLLPKHFFNVWLYGFLYYKAENGFGKAPFATGDTQSHEKKLLWKVLQLAAGPGNSLWTSMGQAEGLLGRCGKRNKWGKKRCKWPEVIWWEEEINKGSKASGKAKKESRSYSQYRGHWVSHKALYLPLLWCYLTFKMVNRLYKDCWFTKWRCCKLTWRQSRAVQGERAWRVGEHWFPSHFAGESFLGG